MNSTANILGFPEHHASIEPQRWIMLPKASRLVCINAVKWCRLLRGPRNAPTPLTCMCRLHTYTLNSYLLVTCHFCLHLVTPRSVLRRPDLVHLSHALLELVVLALLVAVSFILSSLQQADLGHVERPLTYHTLPRQIKFVVPTLVQRYEEMGAAISVS